MTLWFLRGLRRGIVTTRYPARPDPSTADLPTPPAFSPYAIDHALADRLVAVCPSRALRHEGDDLVFDVGACTACTRCRDQASWAIRASGVFELAATARAQLVKRIPLKREAAR
jgi:hypothetical protein